MHDDPGISIQQASVEFRTDDGLVLRGNRYLGPGRPKAAVVVASGFGNDAARYERLVRALAASRFAVWAVDHCAHGRSDGERAVEPAFDRYVVDFGLILERARDELPGRPCYLIGHSLGGTIALAWTLDHQEEIDGITMLAPALRFRVGVTARDGQRVHRVSGRITKAGVKTYLSRLRNKQADAGNVVADDPLVDHGWIRAGTIASISDAGRVALARAHELRIPILTMHGDEDEVLDPAASMEFYRAVGVRGSADNSLITWPGMRHELLNEVESEQVIGVMIGWLNGHYTEWRKANPSGISQRAEA